MSVLKVVGGKPLVGEIDISGSKNAALAILASVPLVDGVVVLKNVPDISDVRTKLELMRGYGISAEKQGEDLILDATQLKAHEPAEELVRRIRTGFYMLGPVLARLGHATLPMPGGCKIGARPVDFHLKGLHALGANIETLGGSYVARTSGLIGSEIYLDAPSAGATQHLMATATLADGCTVIQNASIEPEVVTLAGFLNACGALIEGAGTSTITITGVSKLTSGQFRVPADRIQAGTYLLAAAATRGDVTVRGILPENQIALINKMREAGIHAEEGSDYVRVWADSRPRGIRVKTMPYPGFPTDIQQPMSAFLALASGPSVIEETIYESRIGHVQELNRMGAKMRVEGRSTYIEGVNGLVGATVEASDLRAGAALCVAALAAEGTTYIKNVHFIDRGYQNLEALVGSLGGDMVRIHDEEPTSVGAEFGQAKP
ncbi:UDP-N-acetylglucosamine 1-carboxyvinyltransferase [Kamptonema cortianum]|nr:UDP-N-acetylglucosamine 1-carboxyvinyltransferase [Geitlerinema splendidum]MDK3155917.1 UDP-N-acetylglucosamine 1-carboxyvinyltransferase [Kamptonema cortianum]